MIAYLITGLVFAAITAWACYLARVRPAERALARLEERRRAEAIASASAQLCLRRQIDQLLRTVHGDELAETWSGRKPS